MVIVATPPTVTDCQEGVAVNEKSWTLSTEETEWLRDPLVPLAVT
jgi:hypothetical protein